MVKDNPLPLIIPIVCTGCRPIVDILDQAENIAFERLLLNQSDKRVIVIKNNGMIPTKWALKGVDILPEEYQIVNTSGELQPTQEARIEVYFKAITERKIPVQITLEVEDVENMGIKQEPKTINIDAEAFDISVDIKYPPDQDSLDFGSVKVGDYKDANFNVKNNGLYKVKFSFVLKKKLFKEMFKVEPMEVELDP